MQARGLPDGQMSFAACPGNSPEACSYRRTATSPQVPIFLLSRPALRDSGVPRQLPPSFPSTRIPVTAALTVGKHGLSFLVFAPYLSFHLPFLSDRKDMMNPLCNTSKPETSIQPFDMANSLKTSKIESPLLSWKMSTHIAIKKCLMK